MVVVTEYNYATEYFTAYTTVDGVAATTTECETKTKKKTAKAKSTSKSHKKHHSKSESKSKSKTTSTSTTASKTATTTSAASSSAAVALDSHNTLRSNHAATALIWDSDLEALAKTWSDKCVFEDGGGDSVGAGSNVAAISGTAGTVAEMIAMWSA